MTYLELEEKLNKKFMLYSTVGNREKQLEDISKACLDVIDKSRLNGEIPKAISWKAAKNNSEPSCDIYYDLNGKDIYIGTVLSEANRLQRGRLKCFFARIDSKWLDNIDTNLPVEIAVKEVRRLDLEENYSRWKAKLDAIEPQYKEALSKFQDIKAELDNLYVELEIEKLIC